MNKTIHFFLSVIFIFSGGITHSYCQENLLAANWEITRVDSCIRGDYPGAKEKKYLLGWVKGTLTFTSDHHGKFESTRLFLCDHKEFRWSMIADSLITIIPDSSERESQLRIKFINQRTCKIRGLIGCIRPRRGGSVFYEITIERKE